MTGLLKLIARWVFSMGITLAVMIYIGAMSSGKTRWKKYKRLLLVLAFFLYFFSIEPVRDLFVMPLENRYSVVKPKDLENSDAYILLGGGIYEKAPISLDGMGIPSRTALPRVVETARLYRRFPKTIYIGGGALDGNIVSEAEVYKKFLEGLGVKENDVRLDTRSRTTYENGKYILDLLEKDGVKNPVLITSALHMPRSVYTFANFGIEVIPAPCGYISERNGYSSKSFIPDFKNISDVRDAMWERIGAFYYKLKFKVKGREK